MKRTTKVCACLATIFVVANLSSRSASAFWGSAGMRQFGGGRYLDRTTRQELRDKMKVRHDSLKAMTPEARMQELEKMWQERENWRVEQEKAWQDFTGFTREQIEEKRDNGETMGQILKDQGKTAEQTQTFLETQGNKRVDRVANKWSLGAETVQKLKDNAIEWVKRVVNRWFGVK